MTHQMWSSTARFNFIAYVCVCFVRMCVHQHAWHKYVLQDTYPALKLIETLCCSAVLDEVDILFNDEDFEVAQKTLINSSPVTTQYLFVTATLPRDIYNELVEIFLDCELIMGPGMHRMSPGLEEVGFKYYLHPSPSFFYYYYGGVLLMSAFRVFVSGSF